MVLTLRFCFSGQKPQEIWAAVKSMRGMSLAGAVALGLFFYLYGRDDHKDSAWGQQAEKAYLTCISYSFLGFFIPNHTVRDRRTADAAL